MAMTGTVTTEQTTTTTAAIIIMGRARKRNYILKPKDYRQQQNKDRRTGGAKDWLV